MIFGVGIDTVDISRFESKINGNDALNTRLFTVQERELKLFSRAARFAAKEALIKALGSDNNLDWHDMEVVNSRGRRPEFQMKDNLVRVLENLGVSRLHLSLSHDVNSAVAMVVAEC